MKPMICSSVNLLFLMSVILQVDGLHCLYAGTADGEQVKPKLYAQAVIEIPPVIQSDFNRNHVVVIADLTLTDYGAIWAKIQLTRKLDLAGEAKPI